MNNFDPKIIGFLCNWCSYAGADLAGVSRIKYPPNIRVIRVMCSGRVDPILIADAFLRGIDGVMVLGCHFGDCHYINGNYNAEKRIIATRKLLSYTPVTSERLYLDWVSAAEGGRYAQLVTDFVQKIKTIGPLKIDEKTEKSLLAFKDVLDGETFRHLTAIEWTLTEKGNVYGEKIPVDDFKKRLEQTLYQEYIRACILRLLKDKNLSVLEVAQSLSIDSDIAFKSICSLQESGDISMVEIKNDYPVYKANKF